MVNHRPIVVILYQFDKTYKHTEPTTTIVSKIYMWNSMHFETIQLDLCDGFNCCWHKGCQLKPSKNGSKTAYHYISMWGKHLQATMNHKCDVKPGILDTLSECAFRGWRMGCFSWTNYLFMWAVLIGTLPRCGLGSSGIYLKGATNGRFNLKWHRGISPCRAFLQLLFKCTIFSWFIWTALIHGSYLKIPALRTICCE